MTKFICSGQKYELGGPKEDTIVLPVKLTDLPQYINVEDYTLLLKSSFHVSLVCIGKIIEKHSVKIPNFLDKVAADFCEFVKTNNVDLIRYRNEFRFASENERRALVVMCDISNLDKFFDLMNRKYKLNLEYPPTHVTLYTLQPSGGIFITDTQDKNKLSKVVKTPDVRELNLRLN